jgi:hypothetical protein
MLCVQVLETRDLFFNDSGFIPEQRAVPFSFKPQASDGSELAVDERLAAWTLVHCS